MSCDDDDVDDVDAVDDVNVDVDDNDVNHHIDDDVDVYDNNVIDNDNGLIWHWIIGALEHCDTVGMSQNSKFFADL